MRKWIHASLGLLVFAIVSYVATAQARRDGQSGQRRGASAESGERRGAPQRSATFDRIEKREYLFKDTNTKIGYAVFVSTKVKKGNKSPLVLALHGAGVAPEQMVGFVSDVAQDNSKPRAN